MKLRKVQLSDRFDVHTADVLLTGTQALIRLPLAQRFRDGQRGWHTAGYVTGYRGSPLGAIDLQMPQAKREYEYANVLFNPGVNEDLAATAIWGTQQAALRGEGTHEGVFAMWYGKGPGVDRSGDVFRHGNLAGTAPKGGVLCALGDDHTAESSTTCNQSEFALVDAMMPILAPAGVQEVLDYGHVGWALSRFSGCWVGLKCVKDTVEVAQVVDGDPRRMQLVTPEDFPMPEGGLSIRLGDTPVLQEERLHRYKRFAVQAFARANRLDQRRVGKPGARFGIVAAGKSWLDVVHALELLGIDDARAAHLGITAYKVGMAWPLETEGVLQFTEGLERIVVVEEKRALIEVEVKEVLFNRARRPLVVGKRDEQGATLFPATMALDPVGVALTLSEQMERAGVADEVLRGRTRLLQRAAAADLETIAVRRPWFCAGCPHNTSTHVPDGSRAYAGIGCHYMVQWMGRQTEGFTHMGGEGANWIGEAPFSSRGHVFQNIGDGTFNHSGSLAIRAAVAAKVNITFKVLFNDAVAMTGGQRNDGGLTVARVAHICRAEGVQRIKVVSDDPDLHMAVDFPPGVSFEDRDDLDRVQRELRDIPGVSVLIYDQTCAAEKRRRRRRGTMPIPERRVFINHLVCEGCGDCNVASNCVAVLPLETPFGRKRQIDQSACNMDYSCVNGFCPSFVSLYGAKVKASAAEPFVPPAVEPPTLPPLNRSHAVLITGVGGTGVVTVGAIIGMAAHLEGRASAVMEMAGLAQKGGAVLVHCRLAPTPADISAIRIAAGEADVVLAGELVVTGAPNSLELMSSERSATVCNVHSVPTGEFASDPDLHLPTQRLLRAIRARTRENQFITLDATRVAEMLVGDAIYANMVILGAAWQSGRVPLSREAILKAIEINGVAVTQNRAAFEIGRWAAVAPEAVEQRIAPTVSASEDPNEAMARRREFLVESRNEACAQRFEQLVKDVARADLQLGMSEQLLTAAVMRGYFKLLAYKDEYEVARLHLQTAELVRRKFDDVRRMTFHLAPPILSTVSSSGRVRKREFGPWMLPVFRVLASLKWLRGTFFDPFGRTAERRAERALIAEYEATIRDLLQYLSRGNYRTAVEIAELPMMIRGYGHVKLRNMETAKERRSELLETFRSEDSVPAKMVA